MARPSLQLESARSRFSANHGVSNDQAAELRNVITAR